MKLGNALVLTPEKARERAKEVLGCVAGGCDPFAEARAEAIAAVQESCSSSRDTWQG